MNQCLSLDFENISAGFNNRELIKNLSGSFKSGAVNLVLGRAGSGKTTLLRLIAGFHKGFSGRILFDQKTFKPQGNLSLAFQDPETLFFNATVGDEISFALKARKESEEEIKEKTEAWLQRWGLEPARFINKHPLELSGGEKRRVALAACTVFMPPVILLDEPLAGLDAVGQQDLARLVCEFAHDHIVVVVSHDPEVFLSKCQQILFLREGGAEWHNQQSFIASALSDPQFYPLPEWYSHLLTPYRHLPDLPEINAASALNFLNRQKKHADQL